jgi:hypothetical protein
MILKHIKMMNVFKKIRINYLKMKTDLKTHPTIIKLHSMIKIFTTLKKKMNLIKEFLLTIALGMKKILSKPTLTLKEMLHTKNFIMN